MGMGEFVKSHPKSTAVGFVIVLLLKVLDFLDLLSGVWGFFFDVPPYQWLKVHFPTMTPEIYLSIKSIINFLTLVTLIMIAVGIFLSIRKQKNEKIPPTNRDNNSLTPEQVTRCIKFLKKSSANLPIKVVATSERLALAQQLVDILRLANRKVLFNESSKDYIFPARTTHNATRFRFRELGEKGNFTDDLRVISTHLSSAHLLSTLRNLFPEAEAREFPDSDEFNYFQIELGGAP
jgi:hypothetical protein